MSTVTVLLPARNAAGTILASLRSILEQPDLTEVVVIDDRSEDATARLVASLGDARIRVVEGPGTGISAALNTGLAAARGTYVARCDADDLLVPYRLSRQRAWLDAHQDFVATSAGFSTIDDKGRHLGDLACGGAAREVTTDLLSGNVLTHLGTWMIRREALQAIGGARPWFETAEDVDLQYRLACVGRVWLDPVPEYLYRLHDKSITHTRKAERLAFFDAKAREFLAERVATNSDPLDRGERPDVPKFSEAQAGAAGLKDQISGHMVAQAWADFSAGNRRAGLSRMAAAVRRNPGKVGYWRGLMVMLVRSATSR